MPNARKVRLVPTPHSTSRRGGVSVMLPPLAVGLDIELVRPAGARLVVQCPVGLGNGAGLGQAVRPKIGHGSGGGAEPSVDRLAVDRAVDDQMGNMNILRRELARH